MDKNISRKELLAQFRTFGLRPTRQRLALYAAMAEPAKSAGNDAHKTVAEIHGELVACGQKISLATVYNAVHQFVAAGIIKEIVVDPGRSFFEINIDDHHHFYNESTGRLYDIPAKGVTISGLPNPPTGHSVNRVEVIVRVGPALT